MKSHKTSVELNQDLLNEARQVLRTKTVNETLNQALLEVVQANARRKEVEAFSRMEGTDLDNPDVMAGAWPT